MFTKHSWRNLQSKLNVQKSLPFMLLIKKKHVWPTRALLRIDYGLLPLYTVHGDEVGTSVNGRDRTCKLYIEGGLGHLGQTRGLPHQNSNWGERSTTLGLWKIQTKNMYDTWLLKKIGRRTSEILKNSNTWWPLFRDRYPWNRPREYNLYSEKYGLLLKS